MIEKGISRKRVVEFIVDSWQEWKNARQEKEKIWQECIQAYLCEVDETAYKEWPWRSKVADTFVQETADSITSSLKNALFPINERYFEVEGLDEIGKNYRGDIEEYLKKKLDESKFILRCRPFLKQLGILGNSAAALPWKTKTRTARRRVLEMRRGGEIRTTVKDVQEVLYDNFVFDTLDIFDVVYNPSVVYIEDSPIIHRQIINLPQLREMEDVYQNLNKVEVFQSSEDEEAEKRKRAKLFGLDYEIPKNSVELLKIYGDLCIDDVVYKDYIAVVANRKVLLRFEPNPYWGGRPIIIGSYDNLWFTPYGRGPIEPILGTYHLINTFTNQKADIINLIINGCFAYVDDGIIDPANLKLRPGGFIEVGNTANLIPLHPNTNVTLAFNEIEFLRRRGERSTAASAYEMGAIPAGRRTAFEANIIRQGSASRFNDITKGIGEQVMEYVLNYYLVCLQQFKFGSGEINDEVLLGRYRVHYSGADFSAIRAFETQQFMQFTDIVARNPVFAQAINPREFIEEWRRLLGIRNKRLIREEALPGGTPEQSPGERTTIEGLPSPDEGMLRAAGLIE